MPNAYRCQFTDRNGSFFSAHIVPTETLAQAIDMCEFRMMAEAKTRECIGFEIWQGGKLRHRLYDSAVPPPSGP